ncbi:MAG: hypothetical protein SO366_02915 [Atopobiaceae bacterium]|nr:hypothetical protein [Atopobiaceae bacterium]
MVGEIEERIDLVQDLGDGDEEVLESAPLLRCRHCARYSDGWCSEWMHTTIGSGYCYMSEAKPENEV